MMVGNLYGITQPYHCQPRVTFWSPFCENGVISSIYRRSYWNWSSYSLGIGESYYHPLLSAMRKKFKVILGYFWRILGAHYQIEERKFRPRLLPITLVFEGLPHMQNPYPNQPRTTMDERASLVQVSRLEINQIMAKYTFNAYLDTALQLQPICNTNLATSFWYGGII